MIKGFIIKTVIILLMSFASISVVAGCTEKQRKEVRNVAAATTQVASDPLIAHSYPPYSEGISGAMTGLGMVVMRIVDILDRKSNKKNSGGQ
jgi:hypothetical protein